MIVSRCTRSWCSCVPAIDEDAKENIYEVDVCNGREQRNFYREIVDKTISEDLAQFVGRSQVQSTWSP